MTALLKYWQIILGAIAGFGLCWMLHLIILSNARIDFQQQLEKDRAAQLQACEKDKLITKDVSNGYAKDIAALNTKLRGLRKSCQSSVSVTRPASGANATSGGAINARPVAFDDLTEYGGDCETYRLKLKNLQEFITKTWNR